MIEITKENLESIYNESNDKLILIDVFTDWCGPCKRLAPHFENLALEFTQFSFYKLNGESEICEKEFSKDVDRYPTILFVKDMIVIDKFIGSNHEHLKEKLKSYLQ